MMADELNRATDVRQPLRGILATALIIGIALGIISRVPVAAFTGWIAFWMLCAIPAILVIAISWQGDFPEFVARRPQPLKGLLFVTLLLPVTAVVGLAHFAVVGGGISPPTPMLMICITSSVAIAFLAVVFWGGWPFTAIFAHRWSSGMAMLVFCYVLNIVLFRIFFNFEFITDAPASIAALDPHGRYNAWHALTFYATSLACMFLLLNFELWPLSLKPQLVRQPVLGLVWTALTLVLGAAAYCIGVYVLGNDPVVFLVRASVAFIFGAIIVLNMLQNSPFGRVQKPWRGVLNTLAAAGIGSALCAGYAKMAPVLAGRLSSGPPGYDLEVWVASALLSMTFPLLAIYAELFGMWPLMAAKESR